MTNFQKAFLAAIVKSLLRGKSLIQAILAYWVSPLTVRAGGGKPSKTLQEFLKEAEAALLGPVSGEGLQELSAGLKKQFIERLQNDEQCMLPSYSHQLPFGSECGEYVALDVGGSTLRVAVVALRGREAETDKQSEIVSMHNYRIGKDIKDLKGMAFFDWMAQKITETLAESGNHEHSLEKPLPVACAWSFPIEQTSMGGGKLLPMGKAFLADQGLLGKDLGEIIRQACKNQGLHVELRAILNDSSACLLSRAYSYTSTRFGLILGTGVNLAAYLPVLSIGKKKFGVRPEAWLDEASHVIVNTELGMFGHDILPLTRWDRALTKQHPRPDFQPLEHLVSGMYLGEIVRLALLEAIETTGLLGGIVPPSLKGGYSLGTDTISMIESDTSSNLEDAIRIFSERHPSKYQPTTFDLSAIKAISSFVSVRSSALVATCVFTLWDLRLDFEQQYIDPLPVSSPERKRVEADMKLESTTVAFNGSVIENYPGYLTSCQRYLNDLVESKGLPERRNIGLVPAKESSLMGAAVALACVERHD
ncbi:N-acetylglucosamine kinase 1 [Conoideocrella luteorostrata]|uniref:Phosphotransferase n=1 Tax=Conoideocrella luteorostrata TaxID=1105319 RepID=A0AAJ0FVK1_9HYPO|nr:N-acetylglucosamine kinase 1 [Conoideocrella luteorostrata]